jgi:group II intron reverse transcriptase/maturase
VGSAGGEAVEWTASDEAEPASKAQRGWGAGGLLWQALARENMVRAWKRVKANKGGAGVDGRTVRDTARYLKQAWPEIRARVLAGTYRPEPVRAVGLPKPGGGVRELGIPTVVDRLIQQALLQVLQPLLDPGLSEHSYGFRPGRSAHQAVQAARAHVQAGYAVVVDVDLEKFFDRVNHDILMERMARRVADKAVLGLIRRYLQAGILAHGVKLEREVGTPQGGPLSPLLANVLLDEVDRELERRGHRFVRYADDCNVYVRSLKAGQRVLKALRGCYEKLRLKVNEAKTAVADVWGRKFLGYALLRGAQGAVRLGVAVHSQRRLREKVRELTRVTVGRSLEQVAQDLRGLIPGWRAYFALAQTPTVFSRLDSWLRTRLRVLRLRQWRRASRIYRELRALGADDSLARRVASLRAGWWGSARTGLKVVLTERYFDGLGVPKFS